MSYSEDYRAGWAAARLQYQYTGGVQPHPPEKVEKREEEAPPKRKPPRKDRGDD